MTGSRAKGLTGWGDGGYCWAGFEIVKELPEAYRDTLLMRLVEGMTGAEIGERSGLTPASVRVNLHRGMKLLRERLARA
jgi:DNA-directed RNA polymerase specialized sigma24 family protein